MILKVTLDLNNRQLARGKKYWIRKKKRRLHAASCSCCRKQDSRKEMSTKNENAAEFSDNTIGYYGLTSSFALSKLSRRKPEKEFKTHSVGSKCWTCFSLPPHCWMLPQPQRLSLDSWVVPLLWCLLVCIRILFLFFFFLLRLYVEIGS